MVNNEMIVAMAKTKTIKNSTRKRIVHLEKSTGTVSASISSIKQIAAWQIMDSKMISGEKSAAATAKMTVKLSICEIEIGLIRMKA